MRRAIWTEERVAFVQENYPIHGVEYVAKKLGLTPKQVDWQARQLKLCSNILCEQCKKNPVKAGRRFCSVRCRNNHISQGNIKPLRKGQKICPICGHIGYRDQDYCFEHMDKSHIWNDQKDDFLKKHYPNKGSKFCAKALGLTVSSVRNRCTKLGLKLTKEATKRIVNAKAQEHMLNHNPMHNEVSKRKTKEHYKKHPDKYLNIMTRLFEGHRRLQKNKPTKLEQKLFGILAGLSVSYEAYYLIKPKFIVDVKIGKVIIQADGEYWHGHPRFEPLTERQLKQQARDKAQDAYLTKCGYTVIRIWERDVTPQNVERILRENGII